MSSVEPPMRLVVLAPNWLGDAVMALPLLADLRRAWPDTRVTMAARGAIGALFAMAPDVSDVITLEGGGERSALRAWRENVRRLHAGNFDAALLLPNSFLSAWLASRAKIPERWGFARDLRGPLLTRAIPRPAATVHQAEYYQALATGLGVAAGDRFARIALAGDDRTRARTLLGEAGVTDGQRFVVFAPGAAYGRAKQWLPERFAELSAMFAREGIMTVLVGAKNDAQACRQIAALSTGHLSTGHLSTRHPGTQHPGTRHPGTQHPGTQHPGTQPPGTQPPGTRPAAPGTSSVIDLSGRTDLTTLAGIVSLGDAVVANDSGAMHLAASTGAHVVAVFGPTDDRKTSPLKATADAPEPRIVAADVWCRPCMLRECPIDHRCMTGVSARAVFEILALGQDSLRS